MPTGTVDCRLAAIVSVSAVVHCAGVDSGDQVAILFDHECACIVTRLIRRFGIRRLRQLRIGMQPLSRRAQSRGQFFVATARASC
jgi:hypothetical protein